MEFRTSTTHPLEIATRKVVGGGRIELTFCPGKHDPEAMTGAWARDLDLDLAVIAAWGASTLVTLVETPKWHCAGCARSALVRWRPGPRSNMC